MLILGIDYGKRKIGLAIAPKNGTVAVPYPSVQVESEREALKKIKKISKEENVIQMVVGMPFSCFVEEKKGKNIKFFDRNQDWLQETKHFIESLQKETGIPVETIDERMTTKEAQKLLRGSGRKDDDAIAAMIILQTYLDRLERNL